MCLDSFPYRLSHNTCGRIEQPFYKASTKGNHLNFKTIFTGLLTASIATLAGTISAREGVRVDWLDDRTYLATDDTIDLVFEVTNPANSGVEIHGFLTTTVFIDAPYVSTPQDGDYFLRTRYPKNCGRVDYCAVGEENGYPILPGETRKFYFAQLTATEAAQEGTELLLKNMRLYPHDDEFRKLSDLNFERNFLAIASNRGPEDPFNLGARNTRNPWAGSATIDAVLNLDYPQSIEAGEPIEIIGTLTNLGPEEIRNSIVLIDTAKRGTHSRSFDEVPCRFKCGISGSFPLFEADSLDMLMTQLFYRDEFLHSGNITLKNPHAVVTDRKYRTAYIYTDDVEISVKHESEVSPILRPVEPIPVREPLFLLESSDPGKPQAVFDPNSGLAWLPLSATMGMSLARVTSQTQIGGQFEGFSVAHSDEVKNLLLNHYWASGLNLSEHRLFLGEYPKYEATGPLIDMLGESPNLRPFEVGYRTAKGLVADAPEDGYRFVELAISQSKPFGGSFFRYGAANIRSIYAGELADNGVWLVREGLDYKLPQEALNFELNAPGAKIAEYEYGQLFLASVSVGDSQYKVSFRLVDREETILELVSVLDEFNQQPAANYDLNSLVLSIPSLGYFVFPDTYLYFSVELQSIRESNPPRFRLISSVPIEEGD